MDTGGMKIIYECLQVDETRTDETVWSGILQFGIKCGSCTFEFGIKCRSSKKRQMKQLGQEFLSLELSSVPVRSDTWTWWVNNQYELKHTASTHDDICGQHRAIASGFVRSSMMRILITVTMDSMPSMYVVYHYGVFLVLLNPYMIYFNFSTCVSDSQYS